MTRLVRVRQKRLPGGLRALAWPLPNGNVIVYVSTALSRPERARAVRLALRECGQSRRKIAAALPLIWLPALETRRARRFAATTAVAGMASFGVFLAQAISGPGISNPPAAIGDKPMPVQIHPGRHHQGSRQGEPVPAPSLLGPIGTAPPTPTASPTSSHRPGPTPSPTRPGPIPSPTQPAPSPTRTQPGPTPTPSPSPTRTTQPVPSPSPPRSTRPTHCVVTVRIGGVVIVRVCL